MSQQDDPTGRAEEQRGSDEATAAATLPFEQALAFQRATADVLLGGLAFVESAQQAGADMTRSMVRSYRDAVEQTTATGERELRRQERALRRPRPQQQPRGETYQRQSGRPEQPAAPPAQREPAPPEYQPTSGEQRQPPTDSQQYDQRAPSAQATGGRHQPPADSQPAGGGPPAGDRPRQQPPSR